jgi:hypothetical protein
MATQPAMSRHLVTLTADDMTSLETLLNEWRAQKFPGIDPGAKIRLDEVSLNLLLSTVHHWLRRFASAKKLFSAQH